MKKLRAILCKAIIAIVLFTCISNMQAQNQTVTNRIVYDAVIKNNDPDDKTSVKNNISEPLKQKFFKLILDTIKSNKIKIYDNKHKEVKYKDAINQLGTNDAHQNIIFDINKINKIRFDEKWMMDKKTFKLTKKVTGFCPVIDDNDQIGEHFNQHLMFWVFPIKVNANGTNNKYIITKRIDYSVFIKSRNNQTDSLMDNIETTQRETFVTNLLNAVRTNKLKAYNNENKLIVNGNFERSDTVDIKDAKTNEFKPKIIVTKTDVKSIVMMKFIEEWSLDTRTFKFTKKVLAIIPYSALHDAEGNLKGYLPLFYIYYDKSLEPKK